MFFYNRPIHFPSNYNGVAFTLCAAFVFSHIIVRSRLFSDNKLTVVYDGGLSSANTSSLSGGRDTSAHSYDKFVSLCPVNYDSRRLGNQLFNFAAMSYVAEMTGRRVVMPWSYVRGDLSIGWIDRWFEVPVVEMVDEVVPSLCPCSNITERKPLAFERSIRRVTLASTHVKTLLTCGWFQSWRYAAGVNGGNSLRRQLRWKPEVVMAVRRFLTDHRPPGWNSTVHFARVGIHIRVGDLLNSRKLAFGYTIPGRGYFRRAIAFFVRYHGMNGISVLQFVVTSDDVDWARTHLRLDQIVASYGPSVSLVYSETADAGFDLALLSACDDVIMSTGTYGWWAGWLAAGKTVYYRGWPRAGSPLHAAFRRRDFFPPHWIAL